MQIAAGEIQTKKGIKYTTLPAAYSENEVTFASPLRSACEGVRRARTCCLGGGRVKFGHPATAIIQVQVGVAIVGVANSDKSRLVDSAKRSAKRSATYQTTRIPTCNQPKITQVPCRPPDYER